MNQDKQDQVFETYLQGDSELSKTYQAASKERPPAHLDDAILAASRRAVDSKPRFAFSPFASDWHVPVALAAVLVLSVGVVITMQREADVDYFKQPTIVEPVADFNRGYYDAEEELYRSDKSLELVEEEVTQALPAETRAASEADFVKAPPAGTGDESPGRNELFSPAKPRAAPREEEASLTQFAPSDVVPEIQPYTQEIDDMSVSSDSFADESAAQAKRSLEVISQDYEKKKTREKPETRFKEAVVTAQKHQINLKDAPASTSVLEEIVVGKQDRTAAISGALAVSTETEQAVLVKIEVINEIWKKGDKDLALKQLRQLLADYPDYDREALEARFPRELIDLLFDNSSPGDNSG